jgi:hypothetical protein
MTFLGPPHKANGKSMFIEANGDAIKARMNSVICTMNLHMQHNLKFWGEALDGLWDGLTAPEQEEWQTRANTHNVRPTETPLPSDIFA